MWNDKAFVTSQVGRGKLRGGSHPTLARGEQQGDEKPLGGEDGTSDETRTTFLVEAFEVTKGTRLWQYKLAAEGDFPSG